jgi:hypothetical protein
MPDVKCPKCGKTVATGTAHCAGCGAELPASSPAEAPRPSAVSMYGLDMAGPNPLHWDAAGLGVALILVAQLLFGFAVVPLLDRALLHHRNPNVFGFTIIVVGVGLAIYFVVGYLLGRYSKAYLVREAAIAAVGAAVVNFVLATFAFHLATSLLMTVIATLLYAGLGLAGGVLGEQLQQKAREQRPQTGAK